MKANPGLAVLFLASFYSGTANAQTPDKSDAGAAPDAAAPPKPYDCQPICRPGFMCVDGRCVSPCNPPCKADQVCAGLGKCVPAPVCDPQCRAGFTCVDGRCVSACNPPCGSGEVCVESGQCVVMTTPPHDSTVWIWRDRSPDWWYWNSPGLYWWWAPRYGGWHHPPPPRHFRHEGGPGGHRHR
jgi:hypothetical protein